MDIVSGYKQSLARKAAESDDYVSEADSTLQSQVSEQEVVDYAELRGGDEVQTKGDPVRGRRYFCFNLIMIIVLSIWVMWNSDMRKQYYPDTSATAPATDQGAAEVTPETSSS